MKIKSGDNFCEIEKYKLYRTVHDLLHPTISKKNISNYKVVLDDKLLNVAIDFEVRFPNEKMIVSDYRNMIISMYMMCRKFIKYISDDSTLLIECDSDDYFTNDAFCIIM